MAARILPIVALAAISIVAVAGAAEPSRDEAKQRQTCRPAGKQLGSRIRTPRRCRTAEQWQGEDEAKSGLPIGAQVTQGQNDGQAAPPPR